LGLSCFTILRTPLPTPVSTATPLPTPLRDHGSITWGWHRSDSELSALSGGATAGIVIGVVFGVTIMIGVAVWVWKELQ
jgi:hypothetical protein